MSVFLSICQCVHSCACKSNDTQTSVVKLMFPWKKQRSTRLPSLPLYTHSWPDLTNQTQSTHSNHAPVLCTGFMEGQKLSKTLRGISKELMRGEGKVKTTDEKPWRDEWCAYTQSHIWKPTLVHEYRTSTKTVSLSRNRELIRKLNSMRTTGTSFTEELSSWQLSSPWCFGCTVSLLVTVYGQMVASVLTIFKTQIKTHVYYCLPVQVPYSSGFCPFGICLWLIKKKKKCRLDFTTTGL